MPLGPDKRTPPPGERRAILQGVYEDNLRTVRNEPSPRKPAAEASPVASSAAASARRTHAPWRVGVALGLLLVVGAGFVLGTLQANGPDEPRGPAAGPAAGPDAAPFLAAPAAEPTAGPEAPIQDLTLANLYGLEVQTIVIDPGHGGVDGGTHGPGGLLEKHVTLDVARRLKARLERHHFRVLLTRETDDALALRERVAFANEGGADLFVSLHVNWLPVDTLSVIETYYFGPRGSDERAVRLAERENEASGYSLAEWRGLVAEQANTMKLQESKRVAGSIQNALVRNIRRAGLPVANWGVKTAPFVVLLGVEAPSILAEIACLSNPEEEARLAHPAYRDRLAAYLEEGVVHYLQGPAAAAALSATDPASPAEDPSTEEAIAHAD